jgi:very-short-patch-repair endonuclease
VETGTNIRALVRDLRRNQTEAERVLWEHLRDRRLAGLKFRRQVPVNGFVVDFFCLSARIAIELDGSSHDNPDQADKDRQRTELLSSAGITVVRFRNVDVLTKTAQVLNDLRASLPPLLAHQERGRGEVDLGARRS